MNTHLHTLEPSEHASVMLDIGAGFGALIVHTPAALVGSEIDAFRGNAVVPFVHAAVRERRLPNGTVYALVYPELPEGEYTLRDTDGRVRHTVEVASGRVTEIDW